MNDDRGSAELREGKRYVLLLKALSASVLPQMKIILCLAALCTSALAADLLGVDPATWSPEKSTVWAPKDAANATRRVLASAGCNSCCFENDCSLAFSQTSPGVCCGAHSARGHVGCCPMGASCVACANIWKCTRSTYVSRSSRCRICSDDLPHECVSLRYGGRGGSILPSIILLLGLCAIAACMFYGSRGEPDVVLQQPVVMGQPQPMYGGGYVMGQPQPIYGGGYGCERHAPNR